MTFDELLAAWRKSRHPADSALIDAIGAQIEVNFPPLPKNKGDASRVWMAAIKSEPPTHLSSRLAQLNAFARTTAASSVWPLIEVISRVEPADPRYATFATNFLLERLASASAKLARRLFDVVEAHGDAGHATKLDAELNWRFLDDGLQSRAERLFERMTKTAQGFPIPEAERKRLLALDWKADTAAKPAEDPLEAVYLAPHDRARRQVLADVLLERGAPRGEFISLQLAGASPKKQKTFLNKYMEQWLGPLADIIDVRDQKPEFTDGFVSEVTVRDVKRNQFLLAADAKEWATVTRVRRGLQRLSPAMRGLKATGPIAMDVIEHWGREKFALPSLQAVWLFGDPTEMADTLQRAPRAVPHVTAAIPGYHATRELRNGLAKLAVTPGIERLRLGSFTVDVVPRLIREITLEWFPKTLQVLEFGDEDRQLRLEREGDGWVLRLFDAEPPHVSSHWKDILFGVRGLVPKRIEVNFSSAEGVADVTDFTRRLSDFRIEPSIRYEQPLPSW